MEKEIVDKFFDELTNTGIPVKREDVEEYAKSNDAHTVFQIQRDFENVTVLMPSGDGSESSQRMFYEKLTVDLAVNCNKTADRMFLNTYQLAFTAGNEKMEAVVFKDFGNTYTVKETFNLMNGGSVTRDFYSRDKDKWYTATATVEHGVRNPSGSLRIKKHFGVNIDEAISNLNVVFKENQDHMQIVKRLSKGDTVETSLKDEAGNINDRLLKVNGNTPSIEIFDMSGKLKAEIKQGLKHVVKAEEKKGIKSETPPTQRNNRNYKRGI